MTHTKTLTSDDTPTARSGSASPHSRPGILLAVHWQTSTHPSGQVERLHLLAASQISGPVRLPPCGPSTVPAGLSPGEGAASFHAHPAPCQREGAASLAHTKFSAGACSPPSLWRLQGEEGGLQDRKPHCSCRRCLCSLLCQNIPEQRVWEKPRKSLESQRSEHAHQFPRSPLQWALRLASSSWRQEQHSTQAGQVEEGGQRPRHTHSKHMRDTDRRETGTHQPWHDRGASRAS